jgi:hypothetical protein
MAPDWISAAAATLAALCAAVAVSFAQASAKAVRAAASVRSADVAEREEQRRLKESDDRVVRWSR